MVFKKIFPTDTCEISDDEKKRLQLEYEVTLFDSRFNFMKDNLGLRPKMVHLFLGTTGTGKSTLFRSIEIDAAKQAPIGIYSSEESLKDTKYLLSKRSIHNSILRNMFFLDERTILKSVRRGDTIGFFRYIKDWLISIRAKAFFFDNLTSGFYEGSLPSLQGKFFDDLKTMGEDLNIPIGLVAHTTSGVKDTQSDLIVSDDIRGSKHPSHMSEYIYIYQRFKISFGYEGERLVGILRVVKSRMADNGGKIYILGFDANKKEYVSDKEIDFGKFNDMFMKRLRLGKK